MHRSTISFPAPILEVIDVLAREERRSRSVMVQLLLEDALKERGLLHCSTGTPTLSEPPRNVPTSAVGIEPAATGEM